MSEREAVEAACERFFDALNAMFVGDLGPMNDLWSHDDDVIYMGPAGVFLIGWPAVLEDWKKQAALNLGGEIHSTERHITLGDDLAVTNHRSEATNLDAHGKPVNVTMRGTNIFRKQGSDWKLVGHHSDPLPFLDY